MKKLIIILLFSISTICQGQGIEIKNTDSIDISGGVPNMLRISNDVVYYNSFNDEAITLFNRMSFDDMNIYQKTFLKEKISQWYDTTEYYTILDSLDSRYFYALQDTNDALLDWLRDSVSIPINTPIFYPWEGYLTNGSSSFLKINYNPGADNKWLLRSNSISLYILTNTFADNKWLLGVRDIVGNEIAIRLSTSNYMYYNNSTGIYSYSHNNNIRGNLIVTRKEAKGDVGIWLFHKRNAANYVQDGLNLTAIPNQSSGITIGCRNNNETYQGHVSNLYSIINVGAGLSATQSQKLYEADYRLLNEFCNPLIIIAGQSNAGGRGYADSLEAPYSERINNVGFIINDTEGDDAFSNLTAGINSSDVEGRFGLEIGLGYQLGLIYDSVYIAKCAHGSTAISAFQRGGTYRTQLINTINNAVEKSGKEAIMFIWYQGEQDWANESETYYEDLYAFLNQLNADIDGVIIRTIIIEVKYDTKAEFTDVHDDQIFYVNAINYTYYKDTDELGYGDYTHLNTNGYIDLGEDIYERSYSNTIE